MKTWAKQACEALLVLGQRVGSARRPRDERRSFILAYHNVVPDGEVGWGDASLHLPVTRFREHLERLGAEATVVPLEAFLGLTPEPALREEKFRVAITFDDAYRGALALAWPELAKRGMPATVFAAPALLGDRVPWWDWLAQRFGRDHGGLRERILEAGGGESEATAWADGLPEERAVHPHVRTVTAEELKRAASPGSGLRIGSHTWSHRCLPALSRGEMELEVQRSRKWLMEAMGPAYTDVLSYPYGRAGQREREAAGRAGYRGAVTLEAHRLGLENGGSATALPRINVPAGLTARGLHLRLARA